MEGGGEEAFFRGKEMMVPNGQIRSLRFKISVEGAVLRCKSSNLDYCMSVIPALKRKSPISLTDEDCEFEVSLGYI